MRRFLKELKKYGFKYAFCVKFMYAYEKVNGPLKKPVERLCDRMYDYAYNVYTQNETPPPSDEEEPFTKVRMTPCGCTLFDCVECGSYNICGRD